MNKKQQTYKHVYSIRLSDKQQAKLVLESSKRNLAPSVILRRAVATYCNHLPDVDDVTLIKNTARSCNSDRESVTDADSRSCNSHHAGIDDVTPMNDSHDDRVTLIVNSQPETKQEIDYMQDELMQTIATTMHEFRNSKHSPDEIDEFVAEFESPNDLHDYE